MENSQLPLPIKRNALSFCNDSCCPWSCSRIAFSYLFKAVFVVWRPTSKRVSIESKRIAFSHCNLQNNRRANWVQFLSANPGFQALTSCRFASLGRDDDCNRIALIDRLKFDDQISIALENLFTASAGAWLTFRPFCWIRIIIFEIKICLTNETSKTTKKFGYFRLLWLMSWFSELIQSTWLVVGLYSDEILLARVNLGMDQFKSSKELRQFFTRKFFFVVSYSFL